MAKLSQSDDATAGGEQASAPPVTQYRIPLVEEELQVSKRVVETGKGVRVHKTITEHEQIVDLPLKHDELNVERVLVGTLIEGNALPTVRYEGDMMIVPVFEEVLLIRKQLRLKEEIRITRHQRELHEPQTILLKTETATVERFDETPTAAPTSSTKGE